MVDQSAKQGLQMVTMNQSLKRSGVGVKKRANRIHGSVCFSHGARILQSLRNGWRQNTNVTKAGGTGNRPHHSRDGGSAGSPPRVRGLRALARGRAVHGHRAHDVPDRGGARGGGVAKQRAAHGGEEREAQGAKDAPIQGAREQLPQARGGARDRRAQLPGRRVAVGEGVHPKARAQDDRGRARHRAAMRVAQIQAENRAR